ncbi:MAG: NAD(P)H-hydrate dehydratase [Erysipelotrichaceae bacterium]
MLVLNEKDSKSIDQIAIKNAFTSSMLMERAAGEIKSEILKMEKIKNIMIVCGPGNNGGDGFALARLLDSHIYNIYLFCPVAYDEMSKDEKEQVDMLPRDYIIHHELIDADFKDMDIIVDALFGSGLNKEISGVYETWIDLINKANAYVISVDIASGIDVNSGQVLGCAVKANITISFHSYKIGQLLYPGKEYSGEIIVRSLGISNTDFHPSSLVYLMDEALARTLLPIRIAHSHKGSYGKVIGVGGSNTMRGALLLAGDGCLHVGVGILSLASPASLQSNSLSLRSAMSVGLDDVLGEFCGNAPKQLEEELSKYDVCFIGNGLGRSDTCKAMVKMVLNQSKNCVIDGDALYELASLLPFLNKSKGNIILTPHLKEFSRLIHQDISTIEKDLIKYGTSFIKDYPNVTLVLKGDTTIIFDASNIYLCTLGNHALSKGGSGDILCGMIAGLLAQHLKPIEAASLAVYLHGLSADLLIKNHSAYTIQMDDIINGLDAAFLKIESRMK